MLSNVAGHAASYTAPEDKDVLVAHFEHFYCKVVN
jgi:hypothetical protein